MTSSCEVKNVLFWPRFSWTQRPDMAQLKELGTLYPPSLHNLLDGLTFHGSPRLQSGLGQNELWRRLRQDVVAKYLLGWRWRCGRHAHRVQKHRRALLVPGPNWCVVVNVLEASRDLNRKKDWRENKRLMVWSFQPFLSNTLCTYGRNQWYFPLLEHTTLNVRSHCQQIS